MIDPDERIINRAIAELEQDHQDLREEARAALHRLFRDRRRLEAECGALQDQLHETQAEVEGMLDLDVWQEVHALRAEVERLRKDRDKYKNSLWRGDR